MDGIETVRESFPVAALFPAVIEVDAGEKCTVRAALNASRTWARTFYVWRSTGDALTATVGARKVSLITFGYVDHAFSVSGVEVEFARRRS